MDLYVSDLDGTLLNSNKKVSLESKNILNELINKGVNFTIATARTPATVVDLLEGVNLKIPATLMNGVLIYDINKRNYIDTKDIHKDSVNKMLKIFKEYKKDFFVYTIRDNHLWVYYREFKWNIEQDFYNERCNKSLKTFVKIEDYVEAIKDSKVINFIIFDKLDFIKEIYEEIKNVEGITTDFYEDIYEKGMYYLEAYSSKASKANGIELLKEYVNHSKLITFGDNVNDIPMFKISDECYAMENAVDKLKKLATNVIDSNNNDGVVKFIKEREGK
ncbi:HAD family hydrolase [Clostridium tarantellae]|uniref:Cof-type HAD-IIB family hydrolase n=1 Tax=Clostridium tarantellae TaxID=39493 RepID=A0A6I1MMP4_9CLOT|nr:HAD family hydrolase [Clostridium tarantellae]MPQ44665.1 Cof-type HAD-IIB family hydrolase [Clostridium tarantellae]